MSRRADKDGLGEMKEFFSGGMPISTGIQGDGCLDSGLDEEVALLLRFIGKNGLKPSAFASKWIL